MPSSSFATSQAVRQTVVLDDVNLSIDEARAGRDGASGTGKSVLLKHIVGLLKPDKGEVWFDGSASTSFRARPRGGAQTVRLPLPDGRVVRLDDGRGKRRVPLVEHTGKSKAEIDQIANQKLAMVGLTEVARNASPVSGGQRKRVALARAIAMDPRVSCTTSRPPASTRSFRRHQRVDPQAQEGNQGDERGRHARHAHGDEGADRILMLNEGNSYSTEPRRDPKNDNPVVGRFVRGEADGEESKSPDK